MRLLISRSYSDIPSEEESWCRPAWTASAWHDFETLRNYGELPISLAAGMALLKALQDSSHFSADLNQNAVRNSC